MLTYKFAWEIIKFEYNGILVLIRVNDDIDSLCLKCYLVVNQVTVFEMNVWSRNMVDHLKNLSKIGIFELLDSLKIKGSNNSIDTVICTLRKSAYDQNTN